jgi:hypothetical protein
MTREQAEKRNLDVPYFSDGVIVSGGEAGNFKKQSESK